jgi:hypothetical protein
MAIVTGKVSWWVVTYTAQGTGAAQLGTVILQATSNSQARKDAAAQLPPNYKIGAARGPYKSQSAAANAGVSTKGGKSVTPIKGTAPTGTKPPSGNGQVSANPSNLAYNPNSSCLISYPSVNLLVTSVNGGCLFTKTEGRAFVGGFMLVAGGVMVLAAGILMTVYSLEKTPAGSAISTLRKAVPV